MLQKRETQTRPVVLRQNKLNNQDQQHLSTDNRHLKSLREKWGVRSTEYLLKIKVHIAHLLVIVNPKCKMESCDQKK